ncbi:MAG: hypothetical protein OXI88_20090 [Gammaproteobacteria bacterium]|nr:hypothetical protein [Gammaproteobacteria bacterium]
MSALQSLLNTYRSEMAAEHDKSTTFQKLVTDPLQAQRLQRVQPWPDWAREKEQDRIDTGIDMVQTIGMELNCQSQKIIWDINEKTNA